MMRRELSLVLLLPLLVGLSADRTAMGDTTDGSCLESWELVDLQPQSPNYLERTQSTSFYARPTVILFLASW